MLRWQNWWARWLPTSKAVRLQQWLLAAVLLLAICPMIPIKAHAAHPNSSPAEALTDQDAIIQTIPRLAADDTSTTSLSGLDSAGHGRIPLSVCSESNCAACLSYEACPQHRRYWDASHAQCKHDILFHDFCGVYCYHCYSAEACARGPNCRWEQYPHFDGGCA